MSNIDAFNVFSFDLGFTLLDYHGHKPQSQSKLHDVLLESLNLPSNIDETEFLDYFENEDKAQYLSMKIQEKDRQFLYPTLQKTFNHFGLGKLSMPQATYLSEPYYNYRYSEFNMTLNPQVREILDHLKTNKKRIILTSNFPERTGPGARHFIKYLLHHYKLDHYFDHLLISGEQTWAKPSRHLFSTLHKIAATDIEKIIHIGDDFEADILGADRLGIPAIWLERRKIPTIVDDTTKYLQKFSDISYMNEWIRS